MENLLDAGQIAGEVECGRPGVSDQALASRIAAGDADAWDRFFDRYSAWAYRFAYRHLGGNRADAEDLCSDILMTAARCIKQFDSARGTLDLWLLGVARHRLARFCRKRRMELPLTNEASQSRPNPDEHIGLGMTETALTRHVVNCALAGLPQRQAAVLIGKYVSGYTVEEIAHSTQSTPKAVESLLARARAAFRSAFKALLDGTSGGDQNG